MYFLTSERLGFRRWDEGDMPLAQQLWGDPRVMAMIGGPKTAEQVAERLRRQLSLDKEFGVQYWPIFWLETEDFVGCCGVRPYQKIHELGYHLRPEFWGKGLAEEAGRAVVKYAFETLRQTELFAGHHPENWASKRVLEKLGFQYVGDEFYPPTGTVNPGYILKRGTDAGSGS